MLHKVEDPLAESRIPELQNAQEFLEMANLHGRQ